MIEIKPINNIPTIFIGGSIEQGTATKWQEEFVNAFKSYDIMLFNPRRDDWDSTWEQRIGDNEFTRQVNWELEHLDKADYIFLYFAPGTKSPISLLELGLYASSGKVIVCCPESFWRKGNVDIVCAKHNIPVLTDLNLAIELLKIKLFRKEVSYCGKK